jgi:transcriptional regulator with XRE-family HTH domain
MLNVLNIKDVKLKVGELVKLLRKNESISQQQLAEKLGLSRYTITNLESGQNATLDTLFKIFQYFDKLEIFTGFIDSEINNRNYDSLY